MLNSEEAATETAREAFSYLFVAPFRAYVGSVRNVLYQNTFVDIHSESRSMGVSYATGVRDYSPEWQSHRRIFQQILRQSAAAQYRPTQTEKIKDMLLAMLTSPDEFHAHLNT